MLSPVLKFCLLIAVPTGFYIPGEIAGDSANASNMVFIHIATIRAAMLFDGSFIAAYIAVVGGVIDAAISNIIIVHSYNDGSKRFDVLLSFPIQLDIGNIACICKLMVWSFKLNLFDGCNRIIYRDMG